MTNINSWLKIFHEHLYAKFPGRIYFFGLQGSYARGEAKETSDIDVVVIFDRLTIEDIRRYRDMLDELPERDKICGFVSGRDELLKWDIADLFQFYHDTLPIKGTLDELVALIDDEAVKRAVHTGACNIYHACVHNFLHERDSEILKGLYKSAGFVIQAAYFLRTGVYVKNHSELSELVSSIESEILEPETSDFDVLSQKLFMWSGNEIKSK